MGFIFQYFVLNRCNSSGSANIVQTTITLSVAAYMLVKLIFTVQLL